MPLHTVDSTISALVQKTVILKSKSKRLSVTILIDLSLHLGHMNEYKRIFSYFNRFFSKTGYIKTMEARGVSFVSYGGTH